MNIGRTSVVYFLSKLIASIFGLAATIVIARILGAESLGIYNLVLALVSWLGIIGRVGITGAISKRISEGEEQEEYAVAGIILLLSMGFGVAICLLLFQSFINSYIGQPITGYVIIILIVTLSQAIVSSFLSGVHLVHLRGLLSPLRTGTRSLIQIGTVLLTGLGVIGLFIGYIVGYLIVISVGLIFVYRELNGVSIPKKHHFQRLFDYAKYAWMGSLQSRMFNYTDILVLGIFVSQTSIGVYVAAWNIAQFLMIFAGAINSSLFPELSKLSVKNNNERIGNLVEEGLSYSGLFLIPGLVGGVILGERILRIYGNEFSQGAIILVILIGANLVMSYQSQILSTLNAIDRPNLSFRVNILFVLSNIIFNLILIYLYDLVGAAVATLLSVCVSLSLGFVYLQKTIEFVMPWKVLLYQGLSAIIMGAVVYIFGWAENTYTLLSHNFITVSLLVSLGAVVYFLVLFSLSEQFRATVRRNIPMNIIEKILP